MVFVCSMSDYFHPAVPDEVRLRTFQVMTEAAERSGHTFQLLTKRPGLAAAFWEKHKDEFRDWHPRIWAGVSVEQQKYAPRLTVLARLPTPVKFVSAEPLLEAVSLEQWLEAGQLQWIIAGGESGPKARPMDPDWARGLRDQARVHRPGLLPEATGRSRKQAGREGSNTGRQTVAGNAGPTLTAGHRAG